ncbi:Ig-like domain-containing protein [Candidatus Dojkabacteria bacterium]|nr:Ig-like domain-containing protein [Candidatus Dojkabacteria bacterium]
MTQATAYLNENLFETLFWVTVVLIPLFLTVNIIKILINKKKSKQSLDSTKPHIPEQLSEQLIAVTDNKVRLFFRKIGRFIKVFFTKNPRFWANFLFFFFDVVLFSAIIGNIYYMFFTKPEIAYSIPELEEHWMDQETPVEIVFNVPVKVEELKENISPNVEGRWEYVQCFPNIPFLNLVRRIKFYPKETIAPETRVVIYITGISRLTKQENHEYARDFYAAYMPTVTSTSPENGFDKVRIEDSIIFNINNSNEKITAWEIITNPAFEFTTTTSEGRLVVTPTRPFDQGTEYTITLYKTIYRYNIETGEVVETLETNEETVLQFKTVPAPGLLDYSPKGESSRVDSPIKIQFDGDVNRKEVEERFTIEPTIDGSISWEENTLTFMPNAPLPYGTTYTIRIAPGFHNLDGGVRDNEIVLSFSTVGEIRILQTTPVANSTGVKVDNRIISIVFNQEVDQASAQQHFTISPYIAGTFSWNGNTMNYTTGANFAYSTTYTATVSAGVKSIYGLDLSTPYSIRFTTASDRTVITGVPWYKQTESFTCNVQATNMVLGYYGVYLGEQGVKNAFGIGQWLNESEGTGGNPHEDWIEFFGIFWEPAYDLVSQYRPAEIKQGWTVQGLTQMIQNGDLAIIWWHNDWSTFYWKTWVTPGGQTITGLNGTHSEVVIGFIGPAENPTHMITNDPWRGAGRIYDIATFTRLWAVYNNTAVVVY